MLVNYHKQVIKFIESLDQHPHAIVDHLVSLLEELGPAIGMPNSRPLGHGLFELRGRRDVSIRLIYCYYRGTAYILNAVVKKQQRLRRHDIDIALSRKSDLT
ncbi:MAG: type II toxin-antitoxin system RelE/ParE family toxin [Candidatus Komeilibacteria bacterium]